MTFCRIFAIFFALTILRAIAAESCLSCRHPREPLSPSILVDLKTNKAHGRDSNIVWWGKVVSKPVACTTQGKLRIRFDKCGPKRTARIDLWFARKVTGFSFNIGDSPTVNGWGKRRDCFSMISCKTAYI
ncbi:hypothetical protein OS493_005838 [Desmophyllum pertusum]|uniref:Uncharacterized protein n=1 Tax=Desmophyllum pertusum TaxID=174260 RepID=A0A9W9YFG4_9CNID|nr:hypothetical protein OS493_005838 [Desmophyllum pertusum]